MDGEGQEQVAKPNCNDWSSLPVRRPEKVLTALSPDSRKGFVASVYNFN